MFRNTMLGLASLALAATPVSGLQSGNTSHEWCREDDRDRSRYDRHCEVREFTLNARDLVSVESVNGGIRVEGWNRNEIQVLAKVETWDRDGNTAASLASDIQVETARNIYADGPQRRGRDARGWSVSYRIMVPASSNLDLNTTNGGISIHNVRGDLDFSATNGGLTLVELAGDVRGRTTNGGVHVTLAGRAWEGRGLDVESTNGGVTLNVPDNFNANLELGTVNGGLDVDFPVTIQGRFSRRRLTTELGSGGAPLRVVTTNGGVRVRRI